MLALKFYKPAEDSAEMKYLRARRAALGGALPARYTAHKPLAVPAAAAFARFAFEPQGSKGEGQGSEMSSTTAFVRMLTQLAKDRGLGKHIVPIVADEARTFGMQTMFRGMGIYSPIGQRYDPEDKDELLYYKEAKDGQILEEGITEAGALSSWIAAATSHANHGVAMLPFYIYYSMFGFQRVADLIWAAADQRSRGFLIGATSGRTTLAGEGLQHQDGSSHLVASTVPNCRAYDPCYAHEVAVIIEEGMQAMLERGEDVFYYLTVMNENYAQADPAPLQREGIVRGMYLFRSAPAPQVRLLGSGAILREVLAAAELLQQDFGIAAAVYSVTSYSELQRDGMRAERARLRAAAGQGGDGTADSWVEHCLGAESHAGDRRHRLRARAARIDPRADRRALRHPGHRRLRAQRHPRGPAALFRGRSPAYRPAGAGGIGRGRGGRARCGGASCAALQPGAARVGSLDAIRARLPQHQNGKSTAREGISQQPWSFPRKRESMSSF